MDLTAAKDQVLLWASTAPSYERIGFLKAAVYGMGPDELKRVICVLTNMKKTAKRKWLGLTEEAAKEDEYKRIRYSEDPECLELPTLPVSDVSACVGGQKSLPEPWWRIKKTVKDKQNRVKVIYRNKKETVGYDAEFVKLLKMEGERANRAAKVAVVGSNYEIVYSATVYHKTGTFMVNKHTLRSNGIGKSDLDKREHVQMWQARENLLKSFGDKLIIVCGGVTDFICADISSSDDGLRVFDIQNFYRWFPPAGNGDSPMSLRDIFFMEFGWDFQGTSAHSAEEDAKATIKIFFEGYIKRMMSSPNRDDEWHREYFEDFVRLKDMDKEKKFFCKSDMKFKDFKVSKCHCNDCKRLFW